MKIHAAESLHWYTRKGEPAYQVPAKSGFMRPATLRDARKLNLVPSVTTIIKCASAPGLERWKLDQMLHAALTLPRTDGESEPVWISRVWQDSTETARKAAGRGTAIHAAIQDYYECFADDRTPAQGEYSPHTRGAVAAIEEWAGTEDDWIVEKSFACSLGFGGKVDLHREWDVVVDFKTKEFDDPESLKTWDEHAMQLSAYREGLNLEGARCAICYVSTTKPGLARVIEIPEEDLSRGWEMFVHLSAYWQAKNNYRCCWPQEKRAA